MVKSIHRSVSLPHEKLEEVLKEKIVELYPDASDLNIVMGFSTRFVDGSRKLDVTMDILDDDQYLEYQEEQERLAQSNSKGKTRKPKADVPQFED